MAAWSGQSREKVLGYRIFIWSIKNLGLRFAYFLLIFVSAYFVFASRSAFRAMFYFFHSRLRFSRTRTLISIFRNYYVFGQTIIDKAVVFAGFQHRLQFRLEGQEHLRQMKNGGILISGHIGNYEIGGQTLDFLDKRINIVVFDAEKEAIKKLYVRTGDPA